MKEWKYAVIGIAVIVAAAILARAYTYKYRAQDTVVVTGLGETEFTSDLIVWSGTLTAEAQNVAAGYAQIEASKANSPAHSTAIAIRITKPASTPAAIVPNTAPITPASMIIACESIRISVSPKLPNSGFKIPSQTIEI